MTSQSDTLRMTASIVDGFSGPLKDMVAKLRTFGDYEKVVHKEGHKFAVQHRNAFEDLRKTMKESGDHVKNVLTPAMIGLGLGAVSAAGAIEKIARTITEFAGTSRELDQLNRSTHVSIDLIRGLQQVTKDLGGTQEEASAGIESFNEKMIQLQKFHRGLGELAVHAPFGGVGGQLRQQLQAAHGTEEAVNVVLNSLDKFKDIAGKQLILGDLGLPKEWAYMQRGQLEQAMKDIGHLTKEQVNAGLQGQQAFNRLSAAVTRLKEDIGSGLAPVLTDIVNTIREFVHEHGPQMADWFRNIATAIRDFDWAGFGQELKAIGEHWRLIVGVGVAA